MNDPQRAEIVESVYVEAFAHLARVPGLEVHCDSDIAWKVSPGIAWANCGVRVRLSPKNAEKRLDQILARYRTNARGAAFWLGSSAEPPGIESLLKARKLRCRKYYPGMYCDWRNQLPGLQPRVPVKFATMTDYSVFRQHPHPFWGRITTPIRRFELSCQQHAAALKPRKSWEFVALVDDQPVGACILFLGKRHVGLFDVGVLETFRNQGIGRSLVRHACSFAREHGAEGAILIATNLGYRVYEHVGFREVSRLGFWYTAKP